MNEPIPKEKQRRLARYIARKIFEAPYGCKPKDVRRIEFRAVGGRSMGGFCESALAQHIAEAMETFK